MSVSTRRHAQDHAKEDRTPTKSYTVGIDGTIIDGQILKEGDVVEMTEKNARLHQDHGVRLMPVKDE